MRRWTFGLVAGLIIFTCYVGWGLIYPNYEWRQKMTISVDYGGQVLTGQSVIAVHWENNAFWGKFVSSPPAFKLRVNGEAPFVVMPNGRVLFALLMSKEDAEYSGNIFGRALFNLPGRVWGGSRFSAIVRHKGPLELPRNHYPVLVTFDDILDPATVQRVDPDNLAASFGPGVSLKSVALEIADEPVTEDAVEGVLGWLESIGRERTTFIPNPPRLLKDAADPDIQYISSGSFSTELYK